MNRYIYALLLLLGLSVLSSCNKEVRIESNQQEFVATLPSTLTKTTITDDGKVSWESTDAIGIFDENMATPVKATIKSISSDGKTAIFTPSTEITKAIGAIFPYDESATMSDNSTISINLGATRSGNFADANIEAAKANGNSLSFKIVAAVFKFKVSDEDAVSAKLSMPKSVGTLGITLGATITATLDESTATDEIEVSNIVADKDYYIAIAPKQYSNISYSWYNNNGELLGEASLGKAITVSTSSFYTWGDLTEHEDLVVFSDSTFKSYCVDNFDLNGDEEISKTEASKVSEINVQGKKIKSLVGIEDFINLITLDCRGNQLSSIDISKNTALIKMECSNNSIASLDVSKNTSLEYLDCSHCSLTNLDVSKNTKLDSLDCSYNSFTSLDVSKNISLKYLVCISCALNSLDISKNTALKFLDCCCNSLRSLDVSKNTTLDLLECGNNFLTSLDVSGTSLTSLWCYSNEIDNLKISECTTLKDLNCMLNDLSILDVSKNTALKYLDCNNNRLNNLNVSNNTSLTELYCFRCSLTTLDVSKNTALESLSCSDNSLTTLDISNNTLLKSLDCKNNQIAYIYVWKSFDSTQYPSFSKDDSAIYVEAGSGIGNIEDYTITNPWD